MAKTPAMTDEEYLNDCLVIRPENIQEEYIRLPADLAYWNHQYSLAQEEYLRAKLATEVLRARLLPIIRQALMDAGGRVTEAQVEAGIDSNDGYIAACERLIEGEVQKSELYGRLDAVRTKKEMLISLGAHLRIEMEHDPEVRERVKARRLISGEG